MLEYNRGYAEGLADGKVGLHKRVNRDYDLDSPYCNGYLDGYQTGRYL